MMRIREKNTADEASNQQKNDESSMEQANDNKTANEQKSNNLKKVRVKQ